MEVLNYQQDNILLWSSNTSLQQTRLLVTKVTLGCMYHFHNSISQNLEYASSACTTVHHNTPDIACTALILCLLHNLLPQSCIHAQPVSHVPSTTMIPCYINDLHTARTLQKGSLIRKNVFFHKHCSIIPCS